MSKVMGSSQGEQSHIEKATDSVHSGYERPDRTPN